MKKYDDFLLENDIPQKKPNVEVKNDFNSKYNNMLNSLKTFLSGHIKVDANESEKDVKSEVKKPEPVRIPSELVIKKGQKIDKEYVSKILSAFGYTKSNKTEKRGQYSMTGTDILFFPSGNNNPYHIVLDFGDIAKELKTYNNLKNTDDNFNVIIIRPYSRNNVLKKKR